MRALYKTHDHIIDQRTGLHTSWTADPAQARWAVTIDGQTYVCAGHVSYMLMRRKARKIDDAHRQQAQAQRRQRAQTLAGCGYDWIIPPDPASAADRAAS